MDYTKEKFPINNVVLYAKGWYKESESLYSDLKTLLYADGYTPGSDNDIFHIILLKFNDWNEWLKIHHPNKYTSIYKFITLNNYRDVESDNRKYIIYKIFYIWRYCADKTIIKLSKPNFKLLPYYGWKCGMTHKYINNILNKHFGDE